jgi:hypothetical protein
MELAIGATYKTPTHGRYIQVLDIEREGENDSTLSILWIDKDTLEAEPDSIKVNHSDLSNWQTVEI